MVVFVSLLAFSISCCAFLGFRLYSLKNLLNQTSKFLEDTTKSKDLLIQENTYLEIEFAKIKTELEQKTLYFNHLQADSKIRTEETKNLLSSEVKNILLETSQQIALQAQNASAITLQKSTEIHQDITQKFIETYNRLNSQNAIYSQALRDCMQKTDLLLKSLSNPSFAGSFNELNLANNLINLGFKEGEDFVLQLSIEVQNKVYRPDAVLFMPTKNNFSNLTRNVFIIDAKACAYLATFASETNISQEDIIKKINTSLSKHIKDLSSKDYKTSLTHFLSNAGKITSATSTVRSSIQNNSDMIDKILTIMYVPTDEMLTKLNTDILSEARLNQIYIVGPTGLAMLLNIIKENIGSYRIENEYKVIKNLTKELINRFSRISDIVQKINKDIDGAKNKITELSSSFNARLIPITKQIADSGHFTDIKIPEKIIFTSQQPDTIDYSDLSDIKNLTSPK